MPAKLEQDWSDSDDGDDLGSDVETSVQLGIPDGSISSQSDLCDPCVSKIGGRPVGIFNHCMYFHVNDIFFLPF
jgi:pre-rRNA-processing protein TSR4